MKYLVTGKEMKLLDQNTSDYFMVPTQVLMEQAAMGFVQELLLHIDTGEQSEKKPSILVLAGAGNNGADGIAVARILSQMGYEVFVYEAMPQAKPSELYKLQKAIYVKYGFAFVTSVEQQHFDYVIDAIFGIGLSRNVEGEVASLLEKVNNLQTTRIALDIASGVNADTGEILGISFMADYTFTFSFGKVGQYLYPGCQVSGKVVIVPMGITKESWLEKKPRLAAFEESDCKLLPPRIPNSHKGTYGKLLLIAGSAKMAGAACFAAMAAYRMGCGCVKIFTAEDNRNLILTKVPEAIVITYGKSLDKKVLCEEMKWADAIVLGPGLSTTELAKDIVLNCMKNAAVPMVMDADALNVIAEEPEILLRPHPELVLTPHMGEMSRLTKDAISYLSAHSIEAAQEFSQRYNVTCVLKDARTVTAIPYGMTYLNLSGNAGMATAGSGDVLAGVIGSLLAQGMNAELAAPLGVFLHGRAGDVMVQKQSMSSLVASDLLEGLKQIG